MENSKSAIVTLYHKQPFDEPEGMILYNYNMLKLWASSVKRLESESDIIVKLQIKYSGYEEMVLSISKKDRSMYEQFMNCLVDQVLCYSAKHVLEQREHFTKIINEMILQMLDTNKILNVNE